METLSWGSKLLVSKPWVQISDCVPRSKMNFLARQKVFLYSQENLPILMTCYDQSLGSGPDPNTGASFSGQ